MKFLLFLLLPFSCFSNLNWDAWRVDSPYGIYEFDYDGYGHYSLDAFNADQESIQHLKSWYFYKGHVIGTFIDYSGKKAKTGYFVYNELATTGTKFRNKAKWEKCLNVHQLKPKIWTRWYSQSWWLDTSDSMLFFPVFLLFWVPLLFWFYVVLLKNALKYEKFSLKKGYTRTWLMLNVILICCLFKQFIPYSF